MNPQRNSSWIAPSGSAWNTLSADLEARKRMCEKARAATARVVTSGENRSLNKGFLAGLDCTLRGELSGDANALSKAACWSRMKLHKSKNGNFGCIIEAKHADLKNREDSASMRLAEGMPAPSEPLSTARSPIPSSPTS
jgi:hypothetical protein